MEHKLRNWNKAVTVEIKLHTCMCNNKGNQNNKISEISILLSITTKLMQCLKTLQTQQYKALSPPPPPWHLEFLSRWRFPLKNTKWSKFCSLRHALFGPRMSSAVENSRSTAAELRNPVFYLVKSATPWLLCFAEKCDFFTIPCNNYRHFIFLIAILHLLAFIVSIC